MNPIEYLRQHAAAKRMEKVEIEAIRRELEEKMAGIRCGNPGFPPTMGHDPVPEPTPPLEVFANVLNLGLHEKFRAVGPTGTSIWYCKVVGGYLIKWGNGNDVFVSDAVMHKQAEEVDG